ncbi:MAG: hypothetical protein NT069_18820 [Planctomycetota bacterium]|nr:hypothetical protein [Planctomycetota bacterium]
MKETTDESGASEPTLEPKVDEAAPEPRAASLDAPPERAPALPPAGDVQQGVNVESPAAGTVGLSAVAGWLIGGWRSRRSATTGRPADQVTNSPRMGVRRQS